MEKDIIIMVAKSVAMFLIAVAFFVMGQRAGEYTTQVKAARAGAAEFYANPLDGKTNFRWITNSANK